MKLALFLASLLYGIYMTPAQPSCDDLKVKAEVTHTTNSLNNGEVEVIVEGANSTVYYFFHNSKGYPISTDTSNSKLTGLSSGEISCTVITEDGCNKKIKIKID